MIKIPALKPHLHAINVEGEGVFIFSELGSQLFSGSLYETVIPLINGSRTSDEIVDQLSGKFSSAEVYYILTLLDQESIIFDCEEHTYTIQDPFWSSLNQDITSISKKLAQQKISIVFFEENEDFGRSIKSFLELFGISITDGTQSDLTIVVTSDYLDPRLDEFNRNNLASRKQWLLIKPFGVTFWLGPVFVPYETGCWQCLKKRLVSHRIVESFIKNKVGNAADFFYKGAATPVSATYAAAIVATEVAKWLSGTEYAQLKGTVVTIDTARLQLEHHKLSRNLQCRSCSEQINKQTEEDLVILLQESSASHWNESGYRTIDPQITIEKYEKHVSPITGLVSDLKRVGGLGDIAQVYVAGHNFALRYDSIQAISNSLRSKSSGKGKTSIQAKASALCEALERYSTIYQGSERILYSSIKELGSKAIHPNDCMLFSESQFKEREMWNARKSHFNRVPDDMDETTLMHWSPVWSLSKEMIRYLPTSYLYFPSSSECPAKHMSCFSDSNGVAAGNTLEEAILQGFFELVERDAVAIWWYNRVKRPSVDLESLNDKWINDLIRYYEGLERELWVLDLTADLNIPTFVAISRKTGGKTEDIIFGFGAHFDAAIAIQRSLGELNQMLPFALREPGQVNNNAPESEVMDWFQKASISNQDYLQPDINGLKKKIQSYPAPGVFASNLTEAVIKCKEIVEAKGMEMLVLNMTRPEVGLKVVKVLVPGLRHFWARFAEGRLYDVPVKMEWRQSKIAETELNPVAFFL